MLQSKFYLLTIFLTIRAISIIAQLPNPLFKVNQIQHRLQHNIDSLNHRVPQISSNLQRNIRQISARSRAPTIISSVQNQIKGSSQCASNANSAVNDLKYSSNIDVTECVNEAVAKAGDFATQCSRVVSKANSLKNEIVGRVAQCVKTNPGNEVGLTFCLVAQVYPVGESVGSLEQEIEATLGVGQTTAQNIIVALSRCIAQLDSLTSERSRSIYKSYQDCFHLHNTRGT